jgi:DNA repair protein RecO (recombination protein O)
MAEIRTQGIVIRKTNMGEADRLLTIITPAHGKIRAMAKGVRKAKAKLSAWLDMFRYNDFSLVSGRTFYIVTGAQTVEPLIPESMGWDRLTTAYYICELTDKLVEDGHNLPGLFELVHESMAKLSDKDVLVELVQASFEIKLLEMLGMSPQLHKCAVTGQELEAEDGLMFSVRLGGVLSASQSASDDFARTVSANAVKLMRLLASYPLEAVSKVQADEETLKEALSCISGFAAYILEARPKSLAVGQELN